MYRPHQVISLIYTAFLLALTVFVGACSTLPETESAIPQAAYTAVDTNDIFSRYAPVIAPFGQHETFNQIGKPRARVDDRGREQIYVDPTQAVFYVQQRDFETQRGRYTNLIYRIHFEKVPFSLVPFHLTTGKNVGLFVIITLNTKQQPVMITTVHTCGCYHALVPTSYLPDDAYPEDWSSDSQKIFGEALPGLLRYPDDFSDQLRPIIYLRDGTHRVMDIDVGNLHDIRARFHILPATLEPINALKRLTLEDTTTSLYTENGRRQGYVKNSRKPFEFLFMSWWVLDPRVGVDKEYGPGDQTGTVFYTSFKPWRRDDSDMWDFAEFLKYWGWNL